MNARTLQIVLIVTLQLVFQINAKNTSQSKSLTRQGKDLYHYQDDIRSDYPPLSHSSINYPREDFIECPSNPFTSLLGKGLGFMLFKIGALAIIKAIVTGLFLLKIPLFFLKMAFLKTLFFPVLIAPLLLHIFSNQQTPDMKPVEDSPVDMTGTNMSGMGRSMEDDLSTKIWNSMKMFSESEQCIERVACIIGSYNRDSNSVTFSRAMKLFEKSLQSSLKPRMISIREAFKTGVRNGVCHEQDYSCHGPKLFIQQGSEKMQLL